MTFTMSVQCRKLTQLQAGVISRQQAISLAIPPDVIDRLVRAGRWQTLRRGVYLVHSGEPTRAAELWAAVRYAGHGAALSHRTAAELLTITDHSGTAVHLTIPARRRVSPASGLVIHRSSRLAEAVHPSLQPPRIRVEETVLDLVA